MFMPALPGSPGREPRTLVGPGLGPFVVLVGFGGAPKPGAHSVV